MELELKKVKLPAPPASVVTFTSRRSEFHDMVVCQRKSLGCQRVLSAPDSATSQFYINLADNKMLDRKNAPDGVGYCVFGKVVKGEDIVDQMAKVRTTTRAPHSGVPADPITLVKATILEPEKK